METYNPADHMVMCRKYKQKLPKMPKRKPMRAVKAVLWCIYRHKARH